MKTENDMTYEVLLAQLDDTIIQLNSGDLSLEEMVLGYQKGMELAIACHKKLQESEGTLKRLQGEFEEVFDLEDSHNE